MKLALAALCAALSAFAAPAPRGKTKPALTSGTVVQAMVKVAPSPDGPMFREGRLKMSDSTGREAEYKVTPKTTVTLDGKAAKFSKSAAPGVIVLKALYDPATKELSALELKNPPSKPRAANTAEAVTGEIAGTDILRNAISVRSGPRSIHDFSVPEGITIRREAAGKLGEAVGLDALQVGDVVEVYSTDGKTAIEIHARAAR